MSKAKEKKELGTLESCECSNCKGACESRAGWFSPTQIQPLADHFGLSVEETFKKYLAVDWVDSCAETDYKDVFNLAPANDLSPAGGMYDENPYGRCIFLKKGKCSIHEVKPQECKESLHTDTSKRSSARHLQIGREWNKPEFQKLVEEVLGKKLKSKRFTNSL
jgi:Fe-S-cluster containining protein